MRRGLGLALLLAGCGPATAPGAGGGPTAAMIGDLPGPVLLVEAAGAGGPAPFRPEAVNGGTVTWTDDGGRTISLDGGLVVATRGFGADLMSADLGGTETALAGGERADYPRLHSYLDGADRTLFRAFRCRMDNGGTETIDILGARHAVTRVEETCYSTTEPISNVYWVGGDGTLWRTRQWVSQELGVVTTDLIRP